MEDAYVLELSKRRFNDLYLCFCGCASCESNHSFGPAVRPNYIIHYILSGKGCYLVEGQRYDLHSGQGFLIEPDVQTFYQADDIDPWSYVWIGFAGDKAQEYLSYIGINEEQVIFSSENGEELENIVSEMLKHCNAGIANEFFLQSLLFRFFATLTNSVVRTEPAFQNQDNEYIQNALNYIRNNYTRNIRVPEIAQYVGITRNYLFTLFQEHMGMGPKEFLTNYRISRGAELLTFTDHSIESIALSCGYMDPLRFSRAFKEMKGMTPTEFRKTHRMHVNKRLRESLDSKS